MSQSTHINKKILVISLAAAALTIVAGILHLAMTQRSLSREPLQGILFLVGGMAQVFWTIPVIKQWGKIWQMIGIIGTLAFFLLWLFDRLRLLPRIEMPPSGGNPGGFPQGGIPPNAEGGFMFSGSSVPIEISQIIFIGLVVFLLLYKRNERKERQRSLSQILGKKGNLILVAAVAALILIGLFAPLSPQRGGGGPQGQFQNQQNPQSGQNQGIPTTIQNQGNVATGATNLSCKLTPSLIEVEGTPQQIEGPYFVDEKLDRSDITTDLKSGAIQQGVPLRLQIHVYDVDGGKCIPIKNAIVDIWQADAIGLYSDIENLGTLGKNFLRGYQTTNEDGLVEFKTIYPGWYEGRAIHIHIKVRTYDGVQKTSEWTSQFYFDDAANDLVHKEAPYSGHGSPAVKNNDDGIYTGPSTDGLIQTNTGKQLMLQLIKNNNEYIGLFNVGLNLK